MPEYSDSQHPTPSGDAPGASDAPLDAATPSERAARGKGKKSAAKPKRKGGVHSGPQSAGGMQRLQRVLAAAGFGSRRQCEELIVAGRVEVDGRTVQELGTQVDPQESKIYVDGTLLRRQRLVYFVLNKPPGVVTTNRDPQGRTRVIDLIQERERVFAVGRLDRNSEGLILMTNDGELAQHLAHPKYGIRKTYRVTVAGKVDYDKMDQMKKGIYIAEGHVAVDGAKILRHRGQSTELEIVLREGKNREIRRILAKLGHKVMTLQRIAIGPLRLGQLPRGAYRPLTSQELKRLRDEAFYQSRARAPTGGDDPDGSADSRPKAARPKAARPKAIGFSRPTGGRGKSGGIKPGVSGGPEPKPRRSTATEPWSRELEESKTVGTVIGGEQPSPSDTARGGRPKPKSKRTGIKGKRSSEAGNASGAKRRGSGGGRGPKKGKGKRS